MTDFMNFPENKKIKATATSGNTYTIEYTDDAIYPRIKTNQSRCCPVYSIHRNGEYLDSLAFDSKLGCVIQIEKGKPFFILLLDLARKGHIRTFGDDYSYSRMRSTSDINKIEIIDTKTNS